MIHRTGFTKARVLDPDDLRITSLAFDAALAAVGGRNSDPRVREALARFIMERALDGERNAKHLCSGALDYARLNVRRVA